MGSRGLALDARHVYSVRSGLRAFRRFYLISMQDAAGTNAGRFISVDCKHKVLR